VPPDPLPIGVLLCPPDHFDVVDVKNPHMAAHAGSVDRALARAQWEELARAFTECGLAVERIDAQPGLEDMVFAANQTFTGLDASGRRTCLLSQMRHPSRQREVPFFREWFRSRAWRVAESSLMFEGSGDAVWQPGVRRIWMGYGFRSERSAREGLARTFGAEVLSLRLVDERYYHLDTCLCPVDARTAMVAMEAFDDEGRALLRRHFERLVETEEPFACNGVPVRGGIVILDRRATAAARRLGALGFDVRPVDTGEFLKSGGSVFCLKQWLW